MSAKKQILTTAYRELRALGMEHDGDPLLTPSGALASSAEDEEVQGSPMTPWIGPAPPPGDRWPTLRHEAPAGWGTGQFTSIIRMQ